METPAMQAFLETQRAFIDQMAENQREQAQLMKEQGKVLSALPSDGTERVNVMSGFKYDPVSYTHLTLPTILRV